MNRPTGVLLKRRTRQQRDDISLPVCYWDEGMLENDRGRSNHVKRYDGNINSLIKKGSRI